MRGRKPTPTRLKLLRGEKRPSRLNKNEPKPDPAIPDCPDQLDDVSRREWKRVAAELYKLGLLTPLDRAALAVYCSSWALWRGACEELKTGSAVINVRDTNGNLRPRTSPWVAVRDSAAKRMLEAAREFGMSPSARSRISVREPEQEPDPFAEYER